MDMTSGALLPKILIFSGPLILTGILQLLYNAADVVVVGRFAGATSLAAVGSTGSLINLIINVFMGLSVGTSVMVARYYGAGDVRMVQDTVHTSILVALLSGIVVGIFGFVMAKPILRLMDSPDDVIDLAALYVRIYFVGMPFNLLYNFGAGILRAVGDTKRPLYYLTISGAANVILNLILVIVFHMGVAGVAIATVVSQAISMVLVLLCLIRTQGIIHLDLKPEHILIVSLNPHSRVVAKLTDFETADVSGSRGGGAGTKPYSAPEVMFGFRDKPADVYSFGVTMYYTYFCVNMNERINIEGFFDERPEIPMSCPFELRSLIQQCWETSQRERPSFETIHSFFLKQLEGFKMDEVTKTATDLMTEIPKLKTAEKYSWDRGEGTDLSLLCSLLRVNAIPVKEMKLSCEFSREVLNGNEEMINFFAEKGMELEQKEREF